MIEHFDSGLKILSVYMKGSKNMSYDSANLTTSDIKWLGVLPSDLDKYKIPEQCRIPMTEQDIKHGKKMLEEDFIKSNPQWVKVRDHLGGSPLFLFPHSCIQIFSILVELSCETDLTRMRLTNNTTQELELMLKKKEKAEIQALSTFGFQYLSTDYLPRKLREADWL
jgi:meiotic recombination protein SPO11